MPTSNSSPVFFFDADMESVEVHTFLSGSAAVFTRRSPEKVTPNEDSLALIPIDESRGVLAVADGLGGMPGGEQASRVALDALAKAIQEADRSRTNWVRSAIIDGIDGANAAVMELRAGATTLALAEIDGRTVRTYHIGDSPALVISEHGSLKHEALSHSPVGYALHAGFLDEKQAMSHDDRNLVDNVVGAPEMRIEIGPPIELDANDTVLLASDGLCDNLYMGEIIETVRLGKLATVGARLLTGTHERMTSPGGPQPSKADDLTFVIYRPG